MLRTLQRELFTRRMHIEHQKWYENMVSALFQSKNEMRRLLSLGKTAYNSWSEYSRLTNLPFGQLKVFRRYLYDASKSMLLKSANASSKEGAKEWKRIRDTVNSYEPTSPLGSQDTLLPIDIKDLESKLLGPDDKLRQLWKKTSIYEWDNEQGRERKPFKPSKRAENTLSRVRMPGNRCSSCATLRTDMLARLKSLRDELRIHFDLLSCVILV